MIKPVTKFDAYSGQKGIVLTWAKSAGANKYSIYRKQSNKDTAFKLIKNVSNVSTYTDISVKSGSGYTYYIISANEKEKSVKSTTDYEYYVATPVPTVSNLANGVYIKWNKVNGADGYRIIRHVGTKATVLDTVTNLYYLDKSVKHLTTYEYSVQAIHKIKNITYSSAHPKFKTIFIEKAANLKVSANALKVTATWTPDTKVTGYNIYWSTDSSFDKTKRSVISITNSKEKSKIFNASKAGTIYIKIQKYFEKSGKKYLGAFSNVSTLKVSASSIITTARTAIPKKNDGTSYAVKLNTIKGAKTFRCWSQGSFGIGWLKGSGCGVCSFITAMQPLFSKYSTMTPKTFYTGVLQKKKFGAISKTGSIGYGMMKKLVEEAGGKAVVVQKYTLDSAVKDIKNHLSTGQPIVITVRSQAFLGNNKVDKKYTSYAHYIALLGITNDGYVIAADSSKHPWSLDGSGQVRFKIGNLKNIVEHTCPLSNPAIPSTWYTGSGSNGYIKIYV